MTQLQLYTLSGLVFYFLCLIVIGYRDSRRESHEGFVIGNRNVGVIPTLSSVTASFRDGSGIVFMIGASLTIGYSVFWYFIIATISLFLFSQFASKLRQIAAKHDYITVGQLIRGTLGPASEKTISVIILAYALMAIMIQLYVSGNLFARLLDMPEFYGVAMIGSVVAIYLFFGGYGTVVRTDFFQFFIILAMALIPFFVKPDMAEVTDFSSFIPEDKRLIYALCLLGLFSPIASADMWQRIFSARDERVIKWAFPLSGLFLSFMTFTLIVIGMGIISMFPDAVPGELVFVLFEGRDAAAHVPTFILAFFAIGIMSITMSTLDTSCYLFSSTLAKNFLPKRIHDTRERYVGFSRIVFILIITMMCFSTLLVDDIIGTIISVITFVTILAPVYIATIIGALRPSVRLDYLISFSIIVSVVVYIILFSMGIMGDLLLSNIPTLVSLGLCMFCLIMDRLILQKY